MRKGYLVELHYHDGCDYEPMTNDWLIAVFENEEDAKNFCKNNSDDEYYYIEKERVIQFGNRAPIDIKYNDWRDPDDENAEQYWFSIDEIDIV